MSVAQSHIDEWIRRIDAVSLEVQHTFGQLDRQLLTLKPNPASWSIDEILGHLIKVNSSYFPILKSLHEGKYHRTWMGRMPFLPGLFGKMILKSVMPENHKKIRTFPIWEPTPGNGNSSQIIERFITHQIELKQHIRASLDLLKRKVIISSPANRNIVYSLTDAFHIIVTHEERHLGQARRNLEQLSSH